MRWLGDLRRSAGRRHVLGAIATLVVAGTVVEIGTAWAYSGHRLAVANTMQSLRKGMTKSEVLTLLEPDRSRCYLIREVPGGLVCWAHVGIVSDWGIHVTFSPQGRLETARVRTEDGPFHPAEAPPDIQ